MKKTEPNLLRKSKSTPTTRPPLARMLRIHELLRAGKYPNSVSLSAELEVSYKTAMRDIDFMRDQWRMPIGYDFRRKGFFYTRPVESLPAISVSEGELVALLVAQKAIEQYRGTPFERPIANAFEKLAAGLEGQSGISIQRLSEAFSFKPASLGRAEMKTFATAADAVLKSRELVFTYRGLTAGKDEIRRVFPYHLGCISDSWYVIGHDPDRNAIRTFAITRMSNPRITKTGFTIPPGFDISRFLADSFSAFESKETQTVRLWLSPLAARLASERKWHSSQKIKPHADGSAELVLQVGIAPDLESWILSWGEHARVIAPAALKKSIALRLQKACNHYNK